MRKFITVWVQWITIDSIPEKEVQEFRDKTKILEML